MTLMTFVSTSQFHVYLPCLNRHTFSIVSSCVLNASSLRLSKTDGTFAALLLTCWPLCCPCSWRWRAARARTERSQQTVSVPAELASLGCCLSKIVTKLLRTYSWCWIFSRLTASPVLSVRCELFTLVWFSHHNFVRGRHSRKLHCHCLVSCLKNGDIWRLNIFISEVHFWHR